MAPYVGGNSINKAHKLLLEGAKFFYCLFNPTVEGAKIFGLPQNLDPLLVRTKSNIEVCD